MKQYDIFISYRRTSYDSANLIATRLKAAGYSVFFDLETLNSGQFNEQLYQVIEACKDFICVLPPHALDRCEEEGDWVKAEVCHAIQCKKNIIPIMLNGFEWPDPMPVGMEKLKNYQALTASTIEYFDLAMERLQKQYLKSKKHVPFFKILKILGITIISLLIVLGILWGIFFSLSKGVCTKYATLLTHYASSMYVVVDENASLSKDWESFANAMKYEKNKTKRDYLKEDMLERITLTEDNLKNNWGVDSVKIPIGDYNGFLLSLYDIDTEELSMTPVVSNYFYQEYISMLDELKRVVSDPSISNLNLVSMNFDYLSHSFNAYYISYLAVLSSFPDDSKKLYYRLEKDWLHYPKQYKLGEEQTYYEGLIQREMNLAEEKIKDLDAQIQVKSDRLQELENKVIDLEEKAETF